MWQRTILHRVAERSSRDPYIAELDTTEREKEREKQRDKEKKMTEMKEGREIASKRDRNGKTKIETEGGGETRRRGEEKMGRTRFSSSWKI